MAIKNIQQSNIPFNKGIHRNPSSPEEGELSECVNLLPKNGELVGMPLPKSTGITLQSQGGGKDEVLVCVHTTGTEKHYITIQDNFGTHPITINYGFKLVMAGDDSLNLYSDYIFDGQELELLIRYTDNRTETCVLLLTGQVAKVPSYIYDSDLGGVTEATITNFHPKFSNTSVEVIDGRETPYTPSKEPQRVERYTLYWFTEADQERKKIVSFGSKPQQVLPMGNMIIGRSSEGLFYILWKEERYVFLSYGLPELDAQLALSGSFCVERGTGTLKLVDSKSETTFESLLFVLSDPSAPASVTGTGMGGGAAYVWKYRTLTESEKLKKGQTYRIFNYSSFAVRIKFHGDISSSLDTSFAEKVVKENSYIDYTPNLDVQKIGYRCNRTLAEGTFYCLFHVYKGTSVQAGIAVDSTKDNLQSLMGAANKFLSVSMSDNGKFVLPFFARVGLRLYDGSITNLSVPVLLTPNSGCAPYVLVLGDSPGDFMTQTYGSQCDLQFRLSDTAIQNLSLWKDFIESVVVAITPALYSYNEGYEYEEKTKLEHKYLFASSEGVLGLDGDPYTESKMSPGAGQLRSYSADTKDESTSSYYDSKIPLSLKEGDTIKRVSSLPGDLIILRKSDTGQLERVTYLTKENEYVADKAGTYYVAGESIYETNSKGTFYVVSSQYAGYIRIPAGKLLSFTGDFSDSSNIVQAVLPHFTSEEFSQKLTEQNNFYIWGEYPLANLKAGWTTIEPDGRDLTAIETYERIPDDNHSHYKRNAFSLFTYNSKLHLGNIEEELWGGSCLERMRGYVQDVYSESPAKAAPSSCRVVVSLVKNGESVKVDSGWGESLRHPYPGWLFYPDTDAVSAVLYWRTKLTGGGYSYQKTPVSLTKHKYLEGAYWYPASQGVQYLECSEDEACTEIQSKIVSYPNKLYASETDNPIVFPTTQRLSIGSGTILALSTTSTAFSQNPYGRSALQVFCTDGVWELELSDTGRYISKNPTSRDVLSNVESVTMLDQATSFVTASGLKMLTGQGVRSIDDALVGFNVSESNPDIQVPVRVVAERHGLEAPILTDEKVSAELMQEARIAYDYVHNVLHVFVQLNAKWHYVLDIASGEWSMQVLPYSVMAVVPDYPNTLLQASNGTLYRYGDTPSTDEQKGHYEIGYALTRPLSLGDPLARKMLCDLRAIADKTTSDSAVMVAVYASNDRLKWYPLKSLKAFSAKWYRLLIVTHFNELDALSGVVLQHVARFGNKLR